MTHRAVNAVAAWAALHLNPHPPNDRRVRYPNADSPRMRWLLARDYDQQLNAGVDGIDQVVFAVDFVDVDGVGVSPARWPRIVVNEIVSAVVEAAIVIARYAESVLAAEVRVEVGLRDATRVAVIAVALRLLILRVILSRDLLLLLLFRGLLLLLVCGLLLLFGGV